jgi:7-keto-8-aminopelargonate synthetase-like enzyme
MLKKLKAELDQLASRRQLKEFHMTGSRGSGAIETRGRRLVDFTSWDFMALNDRPRFRQAAQAAIERIGVGDASSRSSSGLFKEHVSCEARLAQFLGTASSLLFSSKNQAVISLLTALVNEGDLVLYDEMIQSPVSDALYLVNAQAVSFSSIGALESELEKSRSVRRRLVVLESLSPLTGAQLDMGSVVALTQRHDAGLIVDESYALGAIGLRGAGVCESLGIGRQILGIYGSLSQGLASYGAFVAGDAILTGYLLNRSKTFSNETPLPPHIACAVESAIDLIELVPLARDRLSQLGARLRGGLALAGFRGVEGESPVVCVPLKKLRVASDLSAALYERGFLVEALSRGRAFSEDALVRIVISSAHTEKNIDDLLKAFFEIQSHVKEVP